MLAFLKHGSELNLIYSVYKMLYDQEIFFLFNIALFYTSVHICMLTMNWGLLCCRDFNRNYLMYKINEKKWFKGKPTKQLQFLY